QARRERRNVGRRRTARRGRRRADRRGRGDGRGRRVRRGVAVLARVRTSARRGARPRLPCGRARRGEPCDLARGDRRVTFLVSDEVAMAVAPGRAVVGLETSVIGQGLPYPRNLECVERMDTAIRGTGAIPGWTGVVDGAVRVGFDRPELERFAEPEAAVKVARRDVPVAVASGSLG